MRCVALVCASADAPRSKPDEHAPCRSRDATPPPQPRPVEGSFRAVGSFRAALVGAASGASRILPSRRDEHVQHERWPHEVQQARRVQDVQQPSVQHVRNRQTKSVLSVEVYIIIMKKLNIKSYSQTTQVFSADCSPTRNQHASCATTICFDKPTLESCRDL